MADQPLTELTLPDSGPALGPLHTAEDDAHLKTDIIEEIFGVPGSEPGRASLRTSLEEEPPAEKLKSVVLDLEHALSGVFEEVEGVGQSTTRVEGARQTEESGERGDVGCVDSRDRDKDEAAGDGGGDRHEDGDRETVSNGPAEQAAQPETVTGKPDFPAAASSPSPAVDAASSPVPDSAIISSAPDAAASSSPVAPSPAPAADAASPAAAPAEDASPAAAPAEDASPADAPAAAAAAVTTGVDDDDIVVLDEIAVAPSARGKRRRPGKLRGPASKRRDFGELGPPSSRMPRSYSVSSSDSEIEVEQSWSAEQLKMMSQARRLRLRVNLRLNNACLETGQTARQWAVTLQQRRDARKRHWEEVRRGPRPPPTPRRTSKGRNGVRAAGGRPAARTPPAAARSVPHAGPAQAGAPVNFAATKQLMSLINRGVLQMNSVGSPPLVNGRPRPISPQRGRSRPPMLGAGPAGRGRAMVQIPAASLQPRHLLPAGRASPVRPTRPQGRGGVAGKPPAPGGAADLAAIPDLGEKQRSQLMKLLKGNNGTSISTAAPPQRPQRATRTIQPRPVAPAPPPRPPAPPPPPPPPPEPERPRMVPDYCRTTSGSPDDLFSVYLSGRQQPEKCFVNMQINNQCLKVRLPARPTTTGMIFAQVTRRSMEPICEVSEGPNVFVPPALGEDPPREAARPGPKSRQPPAPAPARPSAPTPAPTRPPPPAPAPARPPARAPAPAPVPIAKPSHQCPKCSKRFPTAMVLEYHMKVNHPPPPPPPPKPAILPAGPHQCPLCTNWKGQLHRLREHLTVIHAPSVRSNFMCFVCGRAWGRRAPNAHDMWARHVMTHAKPVAAAPPAVATAPRQRRQARRPAPGAQPRPVVAGQFPCPQCNAVFPDVSKFPEHWLKVHAGGAGAPPPGPAPPPVPAARTGRPVAPSPHQPQRPLQTGRRAPRPDTGRRFAAKPAPKPSAPAAAAAAPANGDGVLRCTRCGELFADEPAYAQHWISAHTRVKLSADEQAAASRAAASSSTPAAAEAKASEAAEGTPPPPPEVVLGDTEAARGDATMEDAEASAPVKATSEVEKSPPAAAADSATDAPAADTAMDTAPPPPAPAAPAAQNGVAGGAGEPAAAAPDPAEEAANLVPSDADFEMSEETLDKMLEQVVPMKKPKK